MNMKTEGTLCIPTVCSNKVGCAVPMVILSMVHFIDKPFGVLIAARAVSQFLKIVVRLGPVNKDLIE